MTIQHHLQHFYDSHQHMLNPPMSDAERAYLLLNIPHVPRLILEVLAVFNGEKQRSEPSNGNAFFMSSRHIVNSYHMFCGELDTLTDEEMEVHDPNDHPIEVQQKLMDTLWFPFMDYDGDVYFMDMNPTKYGTREQVLLINIAQGCDVFEVVAKHRDDFVQQFLKA